MHGHGKRPAFYVLGESVIEEPAYLSMTGQGCPMASALGKVPAYSPFKFGRMFPKAPPANNSEELIKALVHLGLCMNNPQEYCNQPADNRPGDSTIPAGYTYLGQFIAHEITFDNTQDLPLVEIDPNSLRSPGIDLDSLYGPEPPDEKSKRLYEDGNPARLKLDSTLSLSSGRLFENDLPRDQEPRKMKEALIGDLRNDENLAVAQTQVALIKFHNRVVETLATEGHAIGDLFECARKQVVRHFQWIVLHDYLRRIVDTDVLDCVINHGRRWFRVNRGEDLFMPLEFSAAAFRIGHSMVRETYRWNKFHADGEGGTTSGTLGELFEQTAFSGMIGKISRALAGDWVIDWRRFYEFPEGPYQLDESRINRARKIDTRFDFHLDKMTGFNHHGLAEEKQSITVRNLLRGFALGLPTGEEVAEYIGETPLSQAQVASGPHSELLNTSAFKGKTPLWYYILKEAELNGGSRLGYVGSRIVAETLVGLIENSRYSILNGPKWYPKYTTRGVPESESARFEMVDLLAFAGVVNPYS